MSFVDVLTENDADLLEQEVIEELEAQFVGWEPAEGNLEVWLVKAFARISSTVREQASVVSALAFGKFGETIAGVPPILAAPASVTSTWTMVDTAGYTIPAGTQVAIPSTGDESFGFEVVEAVTVAPGSSATTAGQVVLRAVEPGEAGNGLTKDPTLVDALAFVKEIKLVGTTSGGVDEEEEDAYLDRLTEELQLLSLSLIVQRDFEIDARSVAGIERALCIPGYKWSTKEEGKALFLTVFPVDAAGAKLSAEAKTALQTRQQAKVPSGTTVEVGDPTYTEIDIEAKVTALTGFTTAAVAAAVKARLEEYLSPANWGVSALGDASTSSSWTNSTTLYRNELISVVDQVAGVGRVVTLKLAKKAAELKELDISLTAPAALTKPATLTVTAE